MSGNAPPLLPDVEGMQDAATREGYYEYAAKRWESRAKRHWADLAAMRVERDTAQRRANAAEADAAACLQLAARVGTMTAAEKRKDTHTLNGEVQITADLLWQGGKKAIAASCHELYLKLVKAAHLTDDEPMIDA